MKYRIALVLLGATLTTSIAHARDTIRDYPIAAALKSEAGKLDDGVVLYFGDQPHPRVIKSYGSFATNKKTNAFGKSDEAACEHVFLSAVIELQARARKEGGNAVVGIRSNYRNVSRSSTTEYTCGAGAIVAGAALTGEVVTLEP
ncbi:MULTISPECIES: excinuclease ABC subunit A [Burkholderia]|uniref:Excinuclease ABC subunit A n=1 Tax=Burkholderia anthina TaxID=179879 RepID=A0A6P2G9A5_9BURK|nr:MULTISPECIES: excinuclease ABC subunit A [Burkholderia]AXK62317.1 excinuclease ABC subunit A [Burkholderia sp. IDO3]MBM2768224.1 excinuclease ABC subunit A [Burkholderia anthina]PCD63733.1 excinuclease ABC subunit A [Burkholderia sp. IDO3]QTD94010.1 excinuclease ABC subunit A [Burkholderia anthina]VVU49691.1 excinuclease ABC subunit A [Burkholderia anthina]